MDTGQPTHSLLHFLSVRPLQHPFSLRAAWQVCCGAWGKYPVDHIQQANAPNAPSIPTDQSSAPIHEKTILGRRRWRAA
jgi:hypothetical protein